MSDNTIDLKQDSPLAHLIDTLSQSKAKWLLQDENMHFVFIKSVFIDFCCSINAAVGSHLFQTLDKGKKIIWPADISSSLMSLVPCNAACFIDDGTSVSLEMNKIRRT